jgi:hypothetical protein
LQHQVAVSYKGVQFKQQKISKKGFLGKPNVQELRTDKYAMTPCAV